MAMCALPAEISQKNSDKPYLLSDITKMSQLLKESMAAKVLTFCCYHQLENTKCQLVNDCTSDQSCHRRSVVCGKKSQSTWKTVLRA